MIRLSRKQWLGVISPIVIAVSIIGYRPTLPDWKQAELRVLAENSQAVAIGQFLDEIRDGLNISTPFDSSLQKVFVLTLTVTNGRAAISVPPPYEGLDLDFEQYAKDKLTTVFTSVKLPAKLAHASFSGTFVFH